MREPKTSPLKDPPLNVPGQSGDTKLNDFLLDHFLFPMLCVLGLLLVSIWEWFAYARHIPRQPVWASVVSMTGLFAVALYWRFRWSELQRMKLGRDGERAVGQFLEGHVEAGATVFHDVPSGRGNIDHVIICSRGIYAIETKTRSKPAEPIVVVEDDQLLVNGYAPDRDPIIQSLACANDLRQVLRDSTGKAFEVRPVVVFPGWFINDKRKSRSPVWVLEPKGLPAWIQREEAKISETDVSLATYHLSRYIRTYKKSQ
jgi:hypothetical protein